MLGMLASSCNKKQQMNSTNEEVQGTSAEDDNARGAIRHVNKGTKVQKRIMATSPWWMHDQRGIIYTPKECLRPLGVDTGAP